MKTLILMDTLDTGGTERQMEALVRHWPAALEVEVAAMAAEAAERDRWQKFVTVHMIDRSIHRRWALPLALRSLVRSREIDVVLAAHRFSGLLAKSARVAGMAQPVVCSVRGWHPWGFRQKLLYDYLDVWMTPVAAAIIVNARPIERQLRERRRPHPRIHYIPNGVQPTPVPRGARERIRQELGISGDAMLLSCLGRLVEVKDPCAAVRVLVATRESVPDAQLLYIGEGPLREQIVRESRRLGVERMVHLVGETSAPAEYLAASDLFLSTSVWENTSNAILEAMAQSLPVIARRVGGNPDVVSDHRTGILCPPESEEALREATVALALDPERRARFGEQGRQVVVERFTMDSMVQQHLGVLRECLETR